MIEPQLIAELRLPAQPEHLALVRACVREASKLAGCSDVIAENLVIAVNEACMNVIQHGYRFAEGQEMCLRVNREGDVLVFDLLDQAKPVKLEDLKPRPLDEIRPGGLGVHFILSLMDEVAFVEPPQGFGNRLRMVKNLTQAETIRPK
jgi:anti-sigma regulatory factor (Ser/Thr protein kinase)